VQFYLLIDFIFNFFSYSCKDDTNLGSISKFSGSSGILEPEFSGTRIVGFFFMQISGSNFENPKFIIPKISDPKFSANPNDQP